jgi:hypothetical protein
MLVELIVELWFAEALQNVEPPPVVSVVEPEVLWFQNSNSVVENVSPAVAVTLRDAETKMGSARSNLPGISAKATSAAVMLRIVPPM